MFKLPFSFTPTASILHSMNKRYRSYGIIIITITGAIVGAITSYEDFIRPHLDAYAISMTHQAFGAQPLSEQQEGLIRSVADKMGIDHQRLIIRKMNTIAMRTFGYYNAFAYFPQFFGLPISTIPFLFVSEGFFEDLTEPEQLFLVGHELTHVKEQHTLGFMLIVILSIMLIFLCIFTTKNRIKAWTDASCHTHQNIAWIGTLLCLGFFSLCIVDIGFAYYQRHMEYIADRNSLETLQSYDGCLALLERWDKDFKIEQQNRLELFADHPCLAKRKNFCLALQTHYHQRNMS